MKLEILCQNCGHAFDSPLENIGRIEYTKCENVFRMEYGVKIPCPSCKEILKVLPDQSLFVGIPLKNFKKSSTAPQPEAKNDIKFEPKIITFSVKLDEDKTVIRKDPPLQTPSAFSFFKFSPQKLQTLSLVASCILFAGSVFFIFKNENKNNMGQMDMVSKYYEEELPDYEYDMSGPDTPLSENAAIGGLKDEQTKQLNMTEEQLVNVKRTKTDLDILHLPSLRQITSTYGVRLDPFSKKLAFHGGVDFRAQEGSNVHAALDGEVEYAGRKGLYGNVVILTHTKGYKTLYAHLQKPLVKKGQKVSRKDVIGLAGSTGRSTGPHLHFELHHKGKKKDPLQADLIPK